jgi:hypothetical protein
MFVAMSEENWLACEPARHRGELIYEMNSCRELTYKKKSSDEFIYEKISSYQYTFSLKYNSKTRWYLIVN